MNQITALVSPLYALQSTMKVAILCILSVFLVTTHGGPYTLLLKPSLRAWATSNVGLVARKSLTSLLGTAGLWGSIELVSLARNSATSSEDQQSLDSLLDALNKMRDARAKKNSLSWDAAYVASGGIGLFATAVAIVFSIKKCLNGKNGKNSSDIEEPQIKELTICAQPAKADTPTEVDENDKGVTPCDGVITM